MFDLIEVTDDSVAECAAGLVASVVDARRVAAERFALVAGWADRHHPDRLDREDPAAVRRAGSTRQRTGGEGTPDVLVSAVVELGVLLQTSTGSAAALLRDVLDVRHRLPQLWDAVMTGAVEDWKARQVARITRELGFDQARRVDAEILEALVGLPWGRALDVVHGRVVAADPAAHAARLESEESRRFVSTRRRSNLHGLRTLVARGAAGDIARLEAMVAHLADLLASPEGEPLDTRRAEALALLANPALACVFLARRHPSPPEPSAADPDEDGAPSAVELAAELGRALMSQGAAVVERLRPTSVLYLHVAAEAVTSTRTDDGTQVARAEGSPAAGPIGIDQLREWLAHDRVVVRPAIVPTEAEPVDGYEVPTRLREAHGLLTPYEVFPYGTLPARQADADHTVPYRHPDEGGPPGQTRLGNLGPLSRRHHLVKTFDGFTVDQPLPGVYYWRTPTGYWCRVDQRGTRFLGTDEPSVARVARRHPADGLSPAEHQLRDQLVRHLAA